MRREVWSARSTAVSAAGRTDSQEAAPCTSRAPPHRRSSAGPAGLLPERNFLADALRTETVGGVLLLVAAVAALIWANTCDDSYETRQPASTSGPSALGLHLSVEHWAADGLLAMFFFVAGVELKRELVAGELRSPSARRAAGHRRGVRHGRAGPASTPWSACVGGGSLRGAGPFPRPPTSPSRYAVLAVIGTALPPRCARSC